MGDKGVSIFSLLPTNVNTPSNTSTTTPANVTSTSDSAKDKEKPKKTTKSKPKEEKTPGAANKAGEKKRKTPSTNGEADKMKPPKEKKPRAEKDKEKKEPKKAKEPANPNAPKEKKKRAPSKAAAKGGANAAATPSGETVTESKSEEHHEGEEGEEEEEEEDESIFDEDDLTSLAADKEKMRKLLDQFTPEQNSRYEYYRRSSFHRSTVKKIMQSVCGGTINPKMAIVMAGISKVFVGEVVETARSVMDEWAESGPIRPRHIREAYRRLKLEGKIPFNKPQPVLFKS